MTNSDEFQVTIPATYKSIWDDDFGVRGWKIDASKNDPEVIASTSESGTQIPTSVFVHDILDHYLCGLALSGHRNEATALLLLSQRTDSDPRPDYEQMVIEDIIRGRVNGESLLDFLPEPIRDLIPTHLRNDQKLSAGFLSGYFGPEFFKEKLIEHFFDIGEIGLKDAIKYWKNTGLKFERRKQIGLCIQNLLIEADKILNTSKNNNVSGTFYLSNTKCKLDMDCISIPITKEVNTSH